MEKETGNKYKIINIRKKKGTESKRRIHGLTDSKMDLKAKSVKTKASTFMHAKIIQVIK